MCAMAHRHWSSNSWPGPEARLPADLGADVQTLDRAGIARRYVALYDAGVLQRERASDGPGRIGFVVLLAAITYATLWLDRHARRRPDESSARNLVALPRSAIVVTFVALASTQFWASMC
jgi:hypothetical protein